MFYGACVQCCRAVTAQPDERRTAAVRCAGSALKTRALADQNTEEFRHLIIINASEEQQRRSATTRRQLRWARAHVRILGQALHQGEDVPAHQARWWAVRAGSRLLPVHVSPLPKPNERAQALQQTHDRREQMRLGARSVA